MTDRKVITDLLTSGLINVSGLSRKLYKGATEKERKRLSRKLTNSVISAMDIEGIKKILEEQNLTIKS